MKKELLQLNRRDIISASEIGEFAYCAKAWYLKRCGEEAQSPHLAEGVAFHARHAAGVSQAGRLKRMGELLALLALVLLIVLIVIWFVTAGAR
jgi:hypothetical protein